MNFLQLQAFQTVAKYENLSRAASERFTSQPALSKTIKNMEKELGVELFHRTANTMALNEPGKVFLEFSNRVLSEWQNIQIQLAKYQNDEYLHINFISDSQVLMRSIIPSFLTAHPDVIIDTKITASNQVETFLLNRTADIGFSTRFFQHPEIVCMPFQTSRLIIMMPKNHPKAAKPFLSFQDLENCTILRYHKEAPTERNPLMHEFEAKLKAYGVHCNFVFQTDAVLYKKMLEVSPYWGISSNLPGSIDESFHSDRAKIPLREPSTYVTLYLLRLKEPSHASEVFYSWFRGHYADILTNDSSLQ